MMPGGLVGALLLASCCAMAHGKYTAGQEQHFLMVGERIAHTEGSSAVSLVAQYDDLQQVDLSKLVGRDGRLHHTQLSVGVWLGDKSCRLSEMHLSSTLSLNPAAADQGLNITGDALARCVTTGSWKKGWNQLECPIGFGMHSISYKNAAWDVINSVAFFQGAGTGCSYKFRGLTVSSSREAAKPTEAMKASTRALSLSGGNYATVSGSHSLPTTRSDGAFTVEAWVRPAQAVGGTIMSKYDSRLNGGFMFGLLQSRNIEFAVQTKKGMMTAVKSQRLVPSSSWTHVAASYGDGLLTVFVNGTLDNSVEASDAFLSVNTPVLIGAFFGERDGTDAPKSLFNGALSHLQMWEGVRGRSQILADLAREPKRHEDGLVAFWACDEKAGNHLTDTTSAHDANLAIVQPRLTQGAPVNVDMCDCSDRGDCTDLTCACVDGFHGEHCENSVCVNNCSSHGACNTHGVCECLPGFGGGDCATVTCEAGCSGHGGCHFHWPVYQCLCEPGWTGASCAKVHAEASAEFGWKYKAGVGTCPSTTAELAPTHGAWNIESKGSQPDRSHGAKWINYHWEPPSNDPSFKFTWRALTMDDTKKFNYYQLGDQVKNAVDACIVKYQVGVNVLYAAPSSVNLANAVNSKEFSKVTVITVGSCLFQEIDVVSVAYETVAEATRGKHVCSGHGSCKAQLGKVGICTCDRGWGASGGNANSSRTDSPSFFDGIRPADGTLVDADGTPRNSTRLTSGHYREGFGAAKGESWLETQEAVQLTPPMGQPNGVMNPATAGAAESRHHAAIKQGEYQDCGEATCPNGCSHRGFCLDDTCQCNKGFAGKSCELIACPGFTPCNGQGSCVYENNIGTCSCNEGWLGKDCGRQTECPGDSWMTRTCTGHGECVKGRCMCDAYHYGVDCSMETCPEMCNNVGKCTSYGCVCSQGWAGPACAIDLSFGKGAGGTTLICDGPATECITYSKPYVRDVKPIKSCHDVKKRNHDSGTGVYYAYPHWPKKEALPIFCDMSTAGGGWSLVRRLVTNFAPINDNLLGLRSFGKYNDYLNPDFEEPAPNMKEAFSLRYIDWHWTEMMIAFGDNSRFISFTKKDLITALKDDDGAEGTGQCESSVNAYAKCSDRSQCKSNARNPCNKAGEYCQCEQFGQCKCMKARSGGDAKCTIPLPIQKSDTEQVPFTLEMCSPLTGSKAIMIGTNCNMARARYGFGKCLNHLDEGVLYAEDGAEEMTAALIAHGGTNVWIR